jgi:hypothetical protein
MIELQSAGAQRPCLQASSSIFLAGLCATGPKKEPQTKSQKSRRRMSTAIIPSSRELHGRLYF